jgi:hypothetical protein
VQFTKAQMPAFAWLRDAIDAARSQPAAAVAQATGPTVAERLQQLVYLRDQGLISTDEYEAKRVELLGQL